MTMNKTKKTEKRYQSSKSISLPFSDSVHPLEDSNPPLRFFAGVVAVAPDPRTCALHDSKSSSAIVPFPEKVVVAAAAAAAAAAFVEVGSIGVEV